MANGYTQNFTLRDIFNNPKLKGKIPLVNYQEKQDGKYRTNMQSLTSLVYETAKIGAIPFYKPLKANRKANTIVIDGNTEELEIAFNSVYTALLGQKQMFDYTVNNADIIRSALVEGAKQKNEPKLWLKANTMTEIENFNKRQMQFFIDDVMRNIFYNPDFYKTQKKYGVDEITVNRSSNYERRRQNWAKKVGL